MVRHFTASAVILHEAQVLLLCHRKGGGWIYPGGHLEPGEDFAQAALRETAEEVGIDIELLTTPPAFTHPIVDAVPMPWAFLNVQVTDATIGRHRHIDAVYLARPRTTTLTPAPNEIADARWVPIDKLSALPTPAELPELLITAARDAERLSSRA
ncbi:NUDIX hydrolase [Actinomadura adrarensis]|uniref:NUDIX hydrolase n=1 Tax=Actinomadura adrarensis TaxID=1819600 RepID=A0ABW3CPM2_9ACTN